MSHASLLILLLFASSAPAQEWARFRGPGGAGVAPEANIPSIFTMDDVAWKITLPGKGHSSPVVWKDRLWVTCEGSEPGKRSLVCLSTADGSVRWSRELTFKPHDQHRFNSSASATPAVDAEGVYVFWTSGDRLIASAFDHEGEPSWTRELGPSTAQHGSGASPVVVNGVLLVGNDHEGEGSALFGLRCSDGKTIWKRERDSTRASYATPLVRRTAAGMEAIFASTSHGVTGLDPKTGKLNWETDASFKQRFVGSPAIADGVLFASAGSGGGGKESIAIALPDGPTKKAPEILYRARRRLPYVTSPIGVGDRFFLIADGGFATCVDARSGDEIWNQRLDGSFYCSPVCVGDRIYVVSRSGELFVIAARDEFKLLGRVDLGDPCSATPAIAGGVMYLRTERQLIAVGGENRQEAPAPAGDWPDFRGPTNDGHGPDGARVPVKWSETENVAWKTAIVGKGWSSPVIAEGTAWMTSSTEKGKKLWVIGVDIASGKKRVERVVFENPKPEPKHGLNSFASPSPVVEGDRVWLHFGTYGTACLDAADGKSLWERRDIHCEHIAGPGSSPVLFEDLLIFHMDGGDVQYVIALEKSTGKTRWKTDRDVKLDHLAPDLRKAYNTPILVKVNGALQLVSTSAEATFGYDPRTGKQLWRVRRKGFSMSSRAVAGHGFFYINTGFPRPTITAIRQGGEGDISDTHVAWSYARSVPTMPSPVLIADRLYLVSDGGVVTCLDAKAGKSVWRERIGGEHSSSPIYVAGHLYFFDREGTCVVIRPGDRCDRVAENKLKGGFMASPAVVGNALILRTRTHLYRVEAPGR